MVYNKGKMLSELSTRTVTECFTLLNLTSDHAAVYLALLEHGASPAGFIARKTNLPRSTVYGLLDDLVKNGLVSQSDGARKRTYSPSDPALLQQMTANHAAQVDHQLKNLNQELVQLSTLYAGQQSKFPRVRFHQGEIGIKTVLFDCLWANEVLAICIGETAEAMPSLANEPQYLLDFIKEIERRQVVFKELLQDGPSNREYQAKFASERHQIALFPPTDKVALTHADKQIYDDKIAYISHENQVGVIIEDQNLANVEKALFYSLWDYYTHRK